MLGLFAPSNGKAESSYVECENTNQPLWQADAVHRARNMAQLAMSLADVGCHPSRAWLDSEEADEIRSLSTLFAELSRIEGRSADVECGDILSAIAVGLTRSFGKARGIRCELRVGSVKLPPEKRRALVLIASELVINALKYAFPKGRGGRIEVVLHTDHEGIRLEVKDNGTGKRAKAEKGQGSALMRRLSEVLGSRFEADVGLEGKGYGVVVLVPSRGAQAPLDRQTPFMRDR
ncbi:sensor histidine kinase [Sphingomicrobium sp. XHP0235]|uniref:sensor histidine kinase n=1 Tax=Sphingomicrobium aquimarinum TaxID=3133971 RepID=UPI0031FE5FAD